MSRFKLELGSDHDRARLVLKDRGEVVGIINISWNAYEALLRELGQLAVRLVRESNIRNLGEMLWRDAQRLAEESVELAKQKLDAMKWNQEKIVSFSDELARHAAQAFVGMIPEQS